MSTTTELWSEIEVARERWPILEHPFYERWARGELERSELAAYAGQYRHAVVALAGASAQAVEAAGDDDAQLRATLAEHAHEEADHVALWDGFAAAIGGDPVSAATPETSACARAWAGEAGRPLDDTLVALYAIESGQPAIAQTKRAGLTDFYGLSRGPATAYFDLHVQLDHEHAATARELLEARTEPADVQRLAASAEAVLRANWELLDGVERLNGRSS